MLKTLTLENFKAFGQRTEIELAPITLIFGQNSAGKSSILQSLNLLKQTYEAPNKKAALLPRVEGGISDLGSFNTLLFEHDNEKTLRVGLHVSKGKENKSRCGLEVGFRRPSADSDICVSEMALIGDGHRYDFEVDPATKANPEVKATSKDVYYGDEYWESVYERWHKNRKFVVEAMELELSSLEQPYDHWLGETKEARKLFGYDADVPPVSKARFAAVEEAIGFYSTDFSKSEFISRHNKGSGRIIVSIEQFLPKKARKLIAGLPEYHFHHQVHPHYQDSVPDLLPEVGTDIDILISSIRKGAQEVLDSLFPMGPMRRPPDRYYVFTGSTPSSVGYHGDNLPDLLYRRPDLVEKANCWLDKLKIGYQLDPRRIGDGDTDLFDFRLIDTSRKENVAVSLSDVGYGISQILPFIVQSLASEQRIISIEQPEVHIHPALQADLGELVVEATKDPYNHQFLIETHSEHLVLRIQKLVREGNIDADNVSVLFVSRGTNGSTVQRLHLDRSGDFVDDWPGGFFAERLREMR